MCQVFFSKKALYSGKIFIEFKSCRRVTLYKQYKYVRGKSVYFTNAQYLLKKINVSADLEVGAFYLHIWNVLAIYL